MLVSTARMAAFGFRDEAGVHVFEGFRLAGMRRLHPIDWMIEGAGLAETGERVGSAMVG